MKFRSVQCNNPGIYIILMSYISQLVSQVQRGLGMVGRVHCVSCIRSGSLAKSLMETGVSEATTH